MLHELEDPRLRPLLARTGMRDGLLLCYRDGRDLVVHVWLTDSAGSSPTPMPPCSAWSRRSSSGSSGRGRPPARWRSSTARSNRVLRLVSTGLSNADVAARMTVAPSTVRKHLEHSFRKLGVSNRLAAVKAYEGPSRPPGREDRATNFA